MRTREYYLMHKDVPVAMLEISEEGTMVRARRNELAADHFPLGGQLNDMRLHAWWKARAIPRTRHGSKTALQHLGYASTSSALVNNLALSLCDCYWICPREEKLRWRDVNLFTNAFVDAFGEITMQQESMLKFCGKTRCNCVTSQGDLPKKWCMDRTGRRFLVKGNYGTSCQQSLNEVFASRLHAMQHFEQYTPYELFPLRTEDISKTLGCCCYDFCSDNLECISAWEILQTMPEKPSDNLFELLKDACMRLGLTEKAFSAYMDYLIMTDYLMTNTDRHMNNIAILRNPDTLKVIGFAPIYDSGNAMFYNVPLERLSGIRFDAIRTHSFIAEEVRLLQYVRNRNAVDLEAASHVDFTIYEQDITERRTRIPKLKELYARKSDCLYAFQRGKDLWKDAAV